MAWKESKAHSASVWKYTKYGATVVGSAAGGGAAGALAGGAGAAGAVGAAGTAATSISSVLPLAGVAAAVTVGTGISQIIHFGIHWGWDPVSPLYPHCPNNVFTSLTDLEIDAFLAGEAAGLYRARLADADSTYPELGSLLIQFLRGSVRFFNDAAQGVAAHTIGAEDDFKRSVDAMKSHLEVHPRMAEEVADALEHYSEAGALFPKLSLSEFQEFISLSKVGGLREFLDYEGFLIQRLFNLARVRAKTDIREDVNAWIADGIGDYELAAFSKAKYKTLSLPQIYRVGAECLRSVKLSESPLLANKPRARRK